MYYGTYSPPFARMPVEPLLEIGIFVFLVGISGVVTNNLQTDSYVACKSWHISISFSNI
jgi:hypothetical protein